MVNLPLETPEVELAIRDPRIAAVSFTGSGGAGRKVAAIAGSDSILVEKGCALALYLVPDLHLFSVSGGRVALRPEGSPIMAVASPMMRMASWPKS